MIETKVIVAGLVAGVIMQIGAMVLNAIGFTKLNIPRYLACLVCSGWGAGPFAIATGIHLVISIGFAALYAWAFNYFGYGPSWYTGMWFGLVHDLIVGPFVLPVIDMVNQGVKNRTVVPLGIFTTGYGYTGTATFLIGHLIYGAIVGYILAA